MKTFLKNILLFSVLPFCGLVMLFSLDYDREFAWNFVEGDCGGHGSWIYNRIYQNPEPIDVAYIGSSCIIAGINDSIVQDGFQRQTQLDWHFANLGYCRFGRNLSYVILNDLLKNRSVRYIVLEVRDDEPLSSHPMFPYLAESEAVLKPALIFNQAVFSDKYLAAVSRMEFWKQRLFYKRMELVIDENPFGHASSKAVADPSFLEEVKMKKVKKRSESELAILRNANLRFPLYYLEKMALLCKEHKSELLFLYIPSYGMIDYPPKELKTYQKYGQVFILPAAIFRNKNHWADEAHINEMGAILNSLWFASEFAVYLESRKEK